MRIGIDLGGTKVAGIVMNADGHTVLSRRRPTPHQKGYAGILACVSDLVSALEQDAGGPCEVGMGLPGSISRQKGTLKNCNLTCLNGQPIRTDLETLLKREVRLANDANCFTRSEAQDGAAAGAAVVFGVILGTGVGGGISVGGQILEGANDIAGEWGHMPLLAGGRRCYCGHQGCVETALCGAGLLAHYHEAGGTLATTAQEVAGLAASGRCPHATLALDRYHALFARSLASVINLLDPHVIVLGGGLSNISSLYTTGTQMLAGQIFNDAHQTRIVPNVHGDASGVRGAAMLWQAHEAARRPFFVTARGPFAQPRVQP